MKNRYILTLFLLGIESAVAQVDSVYKRPLKIEGYVEAYYNYSFNQPKNHELPAYLYSYNRHNEVAVNLAMIRASYEKNTLRAKVALMVGSYVTSNLAAEPDGLKNIYEATIGIKLSETKDLWLDAGIFSSHIGYESAIGADVWTMTRSMGAENSPYFSSGVKISYQSPSQKWFLSGLILNGWQRIQRVDGNQTLAFGHQLTYKPSERVLINSSSFVGSDTPDTLRQLRYFHDLYAEVKVSDRLKLIAGFDIGAQQQYKHSQSYDIWYTPSLIGKYRFDDRWSITARGEYYSDQQQVIVGTGSANGFQTWGYSANLDCILTTGVLWRIEMRSFSSKDPIFTRNEQAVRDNTFIGTSLSVKF